MTTPNDQKDVPDSDHKLPSVEEHSSDTILLKGCKALINADRAATRDAVLGEIAKMVKYEVTGGTFEGVYIDYDNLKTRITNLFDV